MSNFLNVQLVILGFWLEIHKKLITENAISSNPTAINFIRTSHNSNADYVTDVIQITFLKILSQKLNLAKECWLYRINKNLAREFCCCYKISPINA